VEFALENVHARDLLTTNSFWTIFHGILGMGPETELMDPMLRLKIKALDYICGGGDVRGMQFIPTKHGLDVQTGPQFVGQGHQDQFIAEMTQWGMPLDRTFSVAGKNYKFEAFVNHAQMRTSITRNQELSWAIIIISQFRGTKATWVNEFGEQLHFEDVVRYELEQKIENSACGGTHRLFGLTWAYHLHLLGGGKKEGVWAEVAAKLERYKEQARSQQNQDGSFSGKYFVGPGYAREAQLRLSTSGHILEWLALYLTDAELREPWVQNAADAVATMILENENLPLDSGGLYHAAHGLHIYQARIQSPGKARPQGLLIPLPPQPATQPGRPSGK